MATEAALLAIIARLSVHADIAPPPVADDLNLAAAHLGNYAILVGRLRLMAAEADSVAVRRDITNLLDDSTVAEVAR